MQHRGGRLHQWWISTEVREMLGLDPPIADAAEAPAGVATDTAPDAPAAAGTAHEVVAPVSEYQATEATTKQQPEQHAHQQEILKAERMERQRLLASEPLPTSKRGFLDSPKFVLRSLVRPFRTAP